MVNSVNPQSILKRLETGKPGGLSYSGILIAFGWALPAYLLFYIPQTWKIPLPDLFWLRQFLILMMESLFFYTGLRYFVKKTLLSHRPLAFVAWLSISCIIVLVTFYTFDQLTRFNEHFASYNNGRKPYQYIDAFLLTMTLLVAGLSISLSVYQEWQKGQKERALLVEQQVSAELSALRSQLNPHFFFNCLHNIYSLSHNSAEHSREALYKLSRMMRYVMDGGASGATIGLLKEIDFILDYIDLMRLRMEHSRCLLVDLPDNISDLPIAPMLLHPLVENAFKHGLGPSGSTDISVILRQHGTTVELEIKNRVFPNKISQERRGIGLNNLRRRLGLLYPDRYSFCIRQNAEYFIALLTIKLIPDEGEMCRS